MCADCVFFQFQGLLNDEENTLFFFTGTVKISTLNKYKQKSSVNNHYDIPKNKNIKSKSPTEQSICLLVTNGNAEKSSDNKQNNNMITNDKVSLHSVCHSFFSLSFFQ
jgi:hypothetical protein